MWCGFGRCRGGGSVSGYYDESGSHRCETCDRPTVYQSFSGGREFYCLHCDYDGLYPDGEGGPRARLLSEPDGAYKLRRQMYDEIAKRKSE